MSTPLRLADLDLTLVIPQQLASHNPRISAHGFSIGHAKSEKAATINMTKLSWTALDRPAYVQIFITPVGVIAIRACKPTDQAARRLDASRRARAYELGLMFDIQPAERFMVDGEIDGGYLLGQVGEELLQRMAERLRRERGEA